MPAPRKFRCSSCRWWERSNNYASKERDWGVCHLYGKPTARIVGTVFIDGWEGHEPRGSDTCGFHNTPPELRGSIPRDAWPKMKSRGN